MTFGELMTLLADRQEIDPRDIGDRFRGEGVGAYTSEERRIALAFYDRMTGKLSLRAFEDHERANQMWIDILEGRQDRADGRVSPSMEKRWTTLYGAPNLKLEAIREHLRKRMSEGP